MNERDIFLAALDQPTTESRSEYLSVACAGDVTLRQRVEGLLQVHEQTGEFLHTPVVERLAEGLAALEDGGETARVPPSTRQGSHDLSFLTPSDQPGSLGRLGHYEVQEVIGAGGMGIVLRAFDQKLHRVVAIKVMAAPLATHAAARKRFQREAQAGAAVCHDHVVTIHAVEEAGDLPYLVMQYVSGMSLQQRIDRDGPLALHEILRIGMQTAAGLAAAHAQGLIHRDIKPANILLENGVERVRITDFGLARVADDASLTQSGAVAGTPHFMAPEQARGEALDARTDLFSLGSVLYAMCTGRSPFRASGSMAVLKRVCEETPTSIRQINPEIPEWLAAIVEKLHAKDPAERFQSAAEVANLLGRHLAHVQHPSVAPLPPAFPLASGGRQPPDDFADGQRVERAADAAQSGGLRPPLAHAGPRRWTAAASALLVCLFGGLSLTEATGVTNLRATAIRIFTPDGVLVVETDDPAVKVTVEGDGGLVITGAGLEEIRLRPGSYRVHADRDGQPVPLDRNLVDVTRGGRAIVKVRLEAAPAIESVTAEQGAFVVLAGRQERKFDTLAEAVEGASDGDTIEIRGNGPFFSDPINIQGTALTIRAGEGFRPVIRLHPEWVEKNVHLLHTRGALVLEGLELHRARPGWDGKSYHNVVASEGAPIWAANCRFVLKPTAFAVLANESSLLDLRNCEFLLGRGGSDVDGSFAVSWFAPTGGRCRMQNCLTVGRFGLALGSVSYPPKPASVVLAGNTVVATEAPVLLYLDPTREPCVGGAAGGFNIEASTNVFDGNVILNDYYVHPVDPPAAGVAFLRRVLSWKGDRNQFSPRRAFTAWSYPGKSDYGIKDLAEWNRFWQQDDSGCRSGKVRYQGGNVLSRADKTPEQLTPEDFRLRTDSAGYKAGKDGKDLGADVDLVGPGPAYERWKKTPEYQQWLKDTGQVQAETQPSAALAPEREAFALLGDKGVAVRKFETLAEAVAGASDGDTIEVRGNGPFVTEPVEIHSPTLTIRAAHGARPVIRLSTQASQAFEPMLSARGETLVLEGLEFQRLDQREWTEGEKPPYIVSTRTAALHIANCRFRFGEADWPYAVAVSCYAPVRVRNCEFFGFAYGVEGVTARLRVLESCVFVGGAALDLPPGGEVRLTRNTVVSPDHALILGLYVPAEEVERIEPLRVEASANVFDGRTLLVFHHELGSLAGGPTPEPAEAEALLRRMVEWRDRGNLYRAGSTSVNWRAVSREASATFPLAGQTPADWHRFWDNPQAEATEGRLRYQGGDLLARAVEAPDQLTPEDFRLRPDSAGYRAGPDGKDLGADVDLVGPGAAYERWKKTSEYQQWLNDVRHVNR